MEATKVMLRSQRKLTTLVVRASLLECKLVHSDARQRSLDALGTQLDMSKTYVQMYMHQSIHVDPEMYGVVLLGGECEWMVPARAHPETPVHLLLYLNRTNHHDLPCSYVAGRATLNLVDVVRGASRTLDFRDEKGEPIATASIKLEPETDLAMPELLASLPAPRLGPTRAELAKWKPGPAIAPRFKGLEALVNHFTPTFFSPKTPKWMLALTGLERECNPTSAEFWDQLARSTCRVLQVPVDVFCARPQDHAEVLGQVAGWVAWQAPYLADGTFSSDDQLGITDQWRVARQTPLWRSNDCEDSARDAHAVVCALQRLRGPMSPVVKALHKLAKWCVIFFLFQTRSDGK
jgi:hypothetical protein